MVNGETVRFPKTNQYVLEFEHFSRAVLDGTPLAYTPDDAVSQMRVIDAVYRSMESGRAETV